MKYERYLIENKDYDFENFTKKEWWAFAFEKTENKKYFYRQDSTTPLHFLLKHYMEYISNWWDWNKLKQYDVRYSSIIDILVIISIH